MYTMLNIRGGISAKTPSPKSDKVIFDTKGTEPPDYQPLPKPRYESCSATSIEKSHNDYYIEEDARSINDADCQFTLEKTSKQHEPYSKLYHFK